MRGTPVLRFGLDEEGGLEGVLKIVGFVKVLEFVRVLLSKDSVLDEEEDDFANVAALGDAPVLKEGGTHWTVFLQDVIAKTEEKFVAADVPFFVAGILGQTVDGEIESFPNEEIRSELKTLFLLQNGGNGVFELIVLHREEFEVFCLKFQAGSESKSGIIKNPLAFQPAGF